MARDEGPGDAPTFRSGMAARLAGLPVGTLRVWERRYQVGGAQAAAAGHRRYSREDVARLGLLKQLVDAGHPIGTIAALDREALERLRAPATAASPSAAAPVRVVLVGEDLAAIAAALREATSGVEVVATCGDASAAAGALAGIRADMVVASLPTVGDGAASLVDALCETVGARGALVAYRFASQGRLESLRDRGHVVVRAPLEPARLRAYAASLPARARELSWPVAQLHPMRFDERTLARVALASTTVACECPHHLVELLLDLGAFERYSAECANRSPADAALHRDLQRVASTARAMLEDALARVAAADGLDLEALRSAT
ncbi:MAG TPA: MerR family transcriptional regulator [Usitatibacter sp.]|nr:MerR family transcriptional regulator [Usitatibacter sp.]